MPREEYREFESEPLRHAVRGCGNFAPATRGPPRKPPRIRRILGEGHSRIRTGDGEFRADTGQLVAFVSLAKLAGSDSLPIRPGGTAGSSNSIRSAVSSAGAETLRCRCLEAPPRSIRHCRPSLSSRTARPRLLDRVAESAQLLEIHVVDVDLPRLPGRRGAVVGPGGIRSPWSIAAAMLSRLLNAWPRCSRGPRPAWASTSRALLPSWQARTRASWRADP